MAKSINPRTSGGSDPRSLAAAARVAAEWGYREVNLNVGCPSERVQSATFGACLMARPGLVAECVAAMREAGKNRFDVPYYGRHGTPTSFALEEAMADLENGFRSVAVCSGLAAITVAILAFKAVGSFLSWIEKQDDSNTDAWIDEDEYEEA